METKKNKNITIKNKAKRKLSDFRNKIHLNQLIPTALTITGLMIAFHAIRYAMKGHIGKALLSIFVATVFDMLDGRVARLLKVSSKLGAELDSLSDMASFVVTPVLVVYIAYLHQLNRLGWLACTFFVVCGCLRLARFNTATNLDNKIPNHFEGMPVPAAAVLIQLPLIAIHTFYQKPEYNLLMAVIEVFLLVYIGFLMISKVPTPSFKNIVIDKGLLTFIMCIFVLAMVTFIHYTWPVGLIVTVSYFIYVCHSAICYYFKKPKA